MGAIARTVDVDVTGSPRDNSQLRSAPGDHRQHDVVDVAVVARPQLAVVLELVRWPR